MINIRKLETELWEAADLLRADSKVTSQEYCMPVLGLIFLRYAYSRFKFVEGEILKKRPTRGGRVLPVEPDDFKTKSAIYLPEEARYDYLLDLPDNTDMGQAINRAMELIESQSTQLKGILPKNYTILQNDLLRELLRIFNNSAFNEMKDDIIGRIYEYFLNKFAPAVASDDGVFFTPKSLVRMIVNIIEPTHGTVLDPACGTSGFLVAAGDYLRETKKEEIFFNKEKKDHFMTKMFTGYDMDRTMLRIGAMNMMTHGVDRPYIEYRDSLSDQNTDRDKYSLILANPPFKGSLDYDTVAPDLLMVCKTKKTELLFLALFLKMLKIGGRCACIVPDGVLFGSSSAHKAIRKALIEENRLEAVISMPSGMFKPYAGVSTGILIFTKTGHGGTDKVWFYDMLSDGLSLDDKRTPVAENDIPDIVARFREREKEESRARTEKSFFVPKEEIVANEYDLSINKYKQTEYKAVEYAPTSVILAELREMEKEIEAGLAELEGML